MCQCELAYMDDKLKILQDKEQEKETSRRHAEDMAAHRVEGATRKRTV